MQCQGLCKSLASDLAVVTKCQGAVSVTCDGQRVAVLEPSGTAFVLFDGGNFSTRRSTYSLLDHCAAPLTETFVSRLCWTADGTFLCGITTEGQLFCFSGEGALHWHVRSPAADASAWDGSFPVSVTAYDDSFLVITRRAGLFLLQARTRGVTQLHFHARKHAIGRAVDYNHADNVLVIVGDGADREGGAPPADAPAPTLAELNASVSVWELGAAVPKLRAYRRAERAIAPATRKAARPPHQHDVWTASVAPGGRHVAVHEPRGGVHVLSVPALAEIDLKSSVPRESPGEAPPPGAPPPPELVSSLAWLDPAADGEGVPAEATSRALLLTSARGVCAGEFVDAAARSVDRQAIELAQASSLHARGRAGASQLALALEPIWEECVQLGHGAQYTAADANVPDKKGVVVPDRYGTTRRIVGWCLAGVDRCSPELLLQRTLASEPLSDALLQKALAVASHHGVQPAEVFKMAWLVGPKAADDVALLIGNVHDDAWVLDQCLRARCASVAAYQALLNHSLNLGLMADLHAHVDAAEQRRQHNGQQPPPPDGQQQHTGAAPLQLAPQDWVLAHQRLHLLAVSDLLASFVAIHGPSAGVAAFFELRDTPLQDAAAAFARSAAVPALSELLRRHRARLGRGALAALSSLPETLATQDYAPLLQLLLQPPGALDGELRPPDFVESDEMIDALARDASLAPALEGRLLTERVAARVLETEGRRVAAGDVEAWLVSRALAVDDATGLLPDALGLLKLGLRLGLGGDVPRAMQSLHLLHAMLRAAPALESAAAAAVAALDARSFCAETLPAQISVLLHACLDGALAVDAEAVGVIEATLAPALSCLPPDVKDAQLGNVLQLEFPERPEWVAGVVAADAAAGCMLFSNVTKLGQAAVQLVGSPAVAADWAAVIRVLQIVAAAFKANAHMPAELKDKWLQSLDKEEGYVRGARLMEKHGFLVAPHTIKHCDAKAAAGLLRRLLGSVAAQTSIAKAGDDAWGHLWTDLRDLRTFAFPQLSLQFMLKELVRAALLAQRWSVAERYLKGTASTPMPDALGEGVVLSAAREFLASASSLAEADSAVQACQSCLGVWASHRPLLALHASVLTALALATTLGAAPPPAAWAEHLREPGSGWDEARFAVASEAVDAAGADVAARAEQLTEMIELLRLPETGTFSSAAAKLRLATALAASSGGLERAAELAQELVQAGLDDCWRLAADLAADSRAATPAARAALAAFALERCDPPSIPALLECLHRGADDADAEEPLTPGASGASAGDFPTPASSRVKAPGSRRAAGAASWEAAGALSGVLKQLDAAAAAAGAADRAAGARAALHAALAVVADAHLASGPPTLGFAAPEVLCLLIVLEDGGLDMLEEVATALLDDADASGRTAHCERVLVLAQTALALHVQRLAAPDSPPPQLSTLEASTLADVLAAARRTGAAAPPAVADAAAAAVALLDTLEGLLEERTRMRAIQRHLPHLQLDGHDAAAKESGVLEIASNAGRAAAVASAAGSGDAGEADELRAQALSLAAFYHVDAWRVHFAMASAAVIYCAPLPPSDDGDPAAPPPFAAFFAAERAVLLQRPEHALWLLAAWVLPALGRDNATQWLLLLPLLRDCCGAARGGAGDAARCEALDALAAFVRQAQHNGGAAAAPPLPLQALLTWHVLALLAPLLRVVERPELVDPEALAWPSAAEPAAALFEHLQLQNASRLRRLFAAWPAALLADLSAGEGPGAAPADAVLVTRATVDLMTLLKLLSVNFEDPAPALEGDQEAGEDDDLADVRGSWPTLLAYARGLMAGMAAAVVAAVGAFALLHAPCPLPEAVVGCCQPNDLEPAAQLDLVDTVLERVASEAPPETAALLRLRSRLRAWRVLVRWMPGASGAAGGDSPASHAALALSEAVCAATGRAAAVQAAAVGLLEHDAPLASVAGMCVELDAQLAADADDGSECDVDATLAAAFEARVASALADVSAAVASVASERRGQAAVAEVEAAVDALSDAGGLDARLVGALREALWAALLRFQGALDDRQLTRAPAQALMAVQQSVAARGRWPGWAPADAQPTLLYALTRSTLVGRFPDDALPELPDLVDVAAAESAFFDLLRSAEASDRRGRAAQLRTLWALLADAWRFGLAFPDGAAAEGAVPLRAAAAELAAAYAAVGMDVACLNVVAPPPLDALADGTTLLDADALGELVHSVRTRGDSALAAAVALASGCAALAAAAVDELCAASGAADDANALQHRPALVAALLLALARRDARACCAVLRSAWGRAVLLPGVRALPPPPRNGAAALGELRLPAPAERALLMETFGADDPSDGGESLPPLLAAALWAALPQLVCHCALHDELTFIAAFVADCTGLHPAFREAEDCVAVLKRYLQGTAAAGAALRASGRLDLAAPALKDVITSQLLQPLRCDDVGQLCEDALSKLEHACSVVH